MKERIITDGVLNIQKVEQVPETFAELKVLCKKIDINKSDNEIEIKLNDNDYLHFYKNGHICCMNEDNEISLGYDIPPNRGWQVIKSLIGE